MDPEACPSSCLHEGSVEVHHPQLRLNLGWGKLCVCPFRDEIHQGLRLDGFAGRIGEGLTHELDRPFGDPPGGLPVLDDLAQGEGRDHRDWMAEEIVLQLVLGENYSIDQLLNLRVPYLGFREHFADEVDWPLDW